MVGRAAAFPHRGSTSTHRLEANGEANEAVRQPAFDAILARNHRVRHRRRVLNERLGAAEAHRQRDDLEPLAHPRGAAQRRVVVAVDDERDCGRVRFARSHAGARPRKTGRRCVWRVGQCGSGVRMPPKVCSFERPEVEFGPPDVKILRAR